MGSEKLVPRTSLENRSSRLGQGLVILLGIFFTLVVVPIMLVRDFAKKPRKPD
ncbi:MAG: hypothetical protein AAB455_01660 [Patescibacteria group bacterium]